MQPRVIMKRLKVYIIPSQMFSGLRATIRREMDTVLDQPHTPGRCKSDEDHANACNDGPQWVKQVWKYTSRV